MKTTILALALTIVAVLPASARNNLDSPDVLLSRAKEGRIQCREVVLDLQQNATEFRDPKTFDSYFYLLPQLQQIATDVNLDEIYPDAVKHLGQLLASNGIRWLSGAHDPLDRLLFYMQWMSVDTAYSFLSNLELENQTLDPAFVRNFATNLDGLIPVVDRTFPDAAGLRLGFRNLLSDLAAKVLSQQNLSEDDRLFWLTKIYSANGYSTAISLLENSILQLGSAKQPPGIHVLLRRFIELSRHLQSDSRNQPFWVLNQCGDTGVAAIMRMVYFLEPFQGDEFSALLGSLLPSHLQALEQQWIAHPPAASYLDEVVTRSEQLRNVLLAQGMQKEAADLLQFEMKIDAPAFVKRKNLEGRYAVTASDNSKWSFSLVLVSGNQLYAEVADSTGAVYKTYTSILFDPQRGAFVGSERGEENNDPGHNQTIEFRMDGSGFVAVNVASAYPTHRQLQGRKIVSFPDYFSRSVPGGKDPSGTYRGKMNFPVGPALNVTLTIQFFGSYTVGRMVTDNGYVGFDFNVGTVGTDGVLYLTTGYNPDIAWTQLRGTVANGVYRGRLVNGAQGLAGQDFVLTRVGE
jgi:hypothetical protein